MTQLKGFEYTYGKAPEGLEKRNKAWHIAADRVDGANLVLIFAGRVPEHTYRSLGWAGVGTVCSGWDSSRWAFGYWTGGAAYNVMVRKIVIYFSKSANFVDICREHVPTYQKKRIL